MRIFHILIFTLVAIFNFIALSSQGNAPSSNNNYYERIPALPAPQPVEEAFSRERPYQPVWGADGYPVLIEKNILIKMKDGPYFEGFIEERPEWNVQPFWMRTKPVANPYRGTYVYVQTATRKHFSANDGIKPIPLYDAFNERTVSPQESWLTLGNEKFFAINFEPYKVTSPHTDFRPYGRIYIGNKYGYIFTASLQQKSEKNPGDKKKRRKQSAVSQ